MAAKSFGKSNFCKSLLAIGFAAGISAGACADTGVVPAPQLHSNTIGAAAADTLITAKVKARFVDDGRLKKSDISVNTINGAVTLTGSASSSQARSAAESVAAHVAGVTSVDNDLKTPSSVDAVAGKLDKAAASTKRAVSDSWITSKVKSEILADSVSQGFEVSVRTWHGVVALKGTLANQGAIDHVKDLAGQVKGVKSVDTTSLTVAST